MATTISGTSITYNDGTVQTRAANAGGAVIFQTPGTFAIPSTTTRIKVTCVGGGGGAPGVTSGEGVPFGLNGTGATGGTSSFGSYISSTGSTSSAPGSTQGASLTYVGDAAAIGAFGRGTAVSSQFGVVTGYNGGHGVKYFDAPFGAQTQVPVIVGAGGGGGGCWGGIPGGGGVTSAQQINGGRGSNAGPNTSPGSGGGGASGTSAQYQGTGGQFGSQNPSFGAGIAGQPGANPYLGLSGGLGGSSPAGSAGNAGYQGIVIVEYF